MKKRRLENLSCQIAHDENILIERPETKIELLDKKIELSTRIRKKKDDKVPMLTKYDMEPYVEVPQNGRSVVDGNATVEDETKTRSSRKAPIFEQEDTSTPSLRLRRDSQPIVIHKHQFIYQGPVVKTKGKNTQISIGSNKGDMQIKHNMDDAANSEDEPLLSDQDHEDVTKQVVPFDVHDTKSHPTSVEQGDNDNKNGGIINYDDVNRGEVFDSVNDENEKIGGHENNETSLKSDKVEDSSLDERKIETDKPATKQLSGTDRKEKSTEKILKRGVSESHESLFNIEDVKAQFSNMDEYKRKIILGLLPTFVRSF
ncbi:uncharacterized protein LOC132734135 [Ruditapes philippinarum]|uniref:uncharacterized protein LOC132734135 n=1 Tax=Ruditapes philippinarum TaxID=129788 RepID=UPI00295C2FCC|nr:uncharacterized protein LOC132734135 [Ruditapes philippinarum]